MRAWIMNGKLDCKKWCLLLALLEAMLICLVVGIALYVASLWLPL